MKNIIVILVCLICTASKKTEAQGVPDTLTYLQSFVTNKAQYIGQPFYKLLDSLQIQIKYFSRFPGISYDKIKETSTEFCFFYPQSPEEIYLTYPSLEIYWQPSLNATQSGILFRSNGGVWTSNVASFYSSGIVADIKVLE